MDREHFFTCCRAIMPECQVKTIGEEDFNAHDPQSGYFIACTCGPELLMWDFGPKPRRSKVGKWVTVKTEKQVFKYLKKFKENK